MRSWLSCDCIVLSLSFPNGCMGAAFSLVRLYPNCSTLQSLEHPRPRAVDENGNENDHADDERIEVRIGVGHHQAILYSLDEHRAEHRTEHAAATAEKASAAQNRGGN